MRSRHNWYYLILFLLLVSIFLVACERPLPGGYNDPYAGSDTTEPDVPISVPEVEPGAYPADATMPEGAAAEDAAYPAEEATVEQGVTAGEEPAADGGEAQPEAESPATEAPADVTPVPEEAPAEEATTEGEAPAEAAAEETAADIPGTHTVAEGENLYRIGLLYGVSWLDLAAANDIVDPANLTVGQVLIIPTPAPELEEEAEAPAEEPAVTEVPVETETTETVELPTTYIVQQGDNLFRIGVNFGVLWTDIVAANGIVDNQIYPGQELIIPAPADTETAAETPTDEAPETPEAPAAEAETVTGTEYIVQEGDTIFSVAFLNGIPWTSLVEANDLQAPYTLEIGQTLTIPASD